MQPCKVGDKVLWDSEGIKSLGERAADTLMSPGFGGLLGWPPSFIQWH